MIRKEYSSGAVKHAFWFLEFRKMITLLLDGNSMDSIKQMNIDKNIFCAPTVERAKQICNIVFPCVRSLDESLYAYFVDADIATVPSDLFAKFQTTFYTSPEDAVFQALGIE